MAAAVEKYAKKGVMVERMIRRSGRLLVPKEKQYLAFLLKRLDRQSREEGPDGDLSFDPRDAAAEVGLSSSETLGFALRSLMKGMSGKCWIETPFGIEPLFMGQGMSNDTCRVRFNPAAVRSVMEFMGQ